MADPSATPDPKKTLAGRQRSLDTPVNPYPDEKDSTDYQISRRHGWIVALVFFPVVAALPLAHHIGMAASGKWSETPAARLLNWRPAQGELLPRLHEVEKLTDKAGYAASIRQRTQAVLTRFGGEGNRKVFLGRGEWLFYQPELIGLRGWGPIKREPFSPMKDPSVAKLKMARDLVIEFAGQLKERGVPLLLVPIPVKPMIYPEFIASHEFKGPAYHPDQLAFYAELRAAGIDVLDLAPAMWDLKKHKQVFLQQDTHWTPDAMKTMAGLLAKHIKDKYPQAARPPEETPLVDARVFDRASFGDLVNLLDLSSPGDLFPQEQAAIVSITGMDTSEKAPIVLLGDSFVNVFDDPALGFASKEEATKSERMKAGFAHHLAIALNEPLDVIAVNGGGATDARQQFARRFDDQVRAKKLVVWAIACRDLILSPPAARDANVKWERVEFNPKTSDGKTAGTVAAVTPSQAKLVIEAKLIEKSKNQDPGSMPYTHALHTAVYEMQKVVSGNFTSTDWLAVQWTFRNKKLEPTAAVSSGKVYRLTLVPESTMPAETKGVNTSDDFVDKLAADRFFVESIEEVK